MRTYISIFIIFIGIIITGISYADGLQKSTTDLNIAERLIRLEEGQKLIINEMRTRAKAVDERFESVLREMTKGFELVNQRFEAIDKRFEAIDQRFEAIDQRFEAIDQRFEAIDQRFETLEKYINQRFESMEKYINQGFESIDKRIDQQNLYFFAILAAFVTMFASIIWIRKSESGKKPGEEIEQIEQKNEQKKQNETLLKQLYEAYQDIMLILQKLAEDKPEVNKMIYKLQPVRQAV
jgi:hypothetical protein